jgi:hypothetical protein
MDIEMINKFLKVVISAVILAASGYASKASAIFVESEPSLTTYEWSATCYDCKDGNLINKRPEDPELWKGVTGSITLSDYTLGDAITSTNFVSFAYTGVSQFLPMFTVGTGEGFDFTTAFVGGTLYTNAELTLELLGDNSSPAPREPSYSVLPTLEDLVSGYDADSVGTYESTLIACRFNFSGNRWQENECRGNAEIAWFEMREAIGAAEWHILQITVSNAEMRSEYEKSNASYIQQMLVTVTPAGWGFGPFPEQISDFGIEFKVLGLPTNASPNQVTAPATLAIFALGLMGLASRRFKKQS